MTPEQLAEIRARAERAAVMEVDEDRYVDRPVLLGYTRALSASADDVPDLVAEIEALRAGWLAQIAETDQLAAVLEAESTHKDGDACPVCDHMSALDVEKVHDENDTLAQQIEKVRALHRSDGHEPDKCGQPNCFTACDECGDVYPCPTLQALDD